MSKYKAPALEKGLDIIEYLSEKSIPQSQIEISLGLDKTANEIYRMLACLEDRGYISKSTSGKYSLTLKLYHLSHTHSPIDGLLRVAKPFMEDLSNATHQACHMSIIQFDKLMVVSQTKSPGPVSLSVEEGSLFPLIKTTSGRVLLANLNENERDSILKKSKDFNELDLKNQNELLQALQHIKKTGYDLKESELTLGVTDIAIAIGDVSSGIYASIAISSLTALSENNKSRDFFIQQLQKTAALINNILGV